MLSKSTHVMVLVLAKWLTERMLQNAVRVLVPQGSGLSSS